MNAKAIWRGATAGIALAIFTVPAGGGLFPAAPKVVVNEVFLGPDRAWVELYGTTGLDLGGWGLSDGKNTYLFPKTPFPSLKAYTVVALGGTLLKPLPKGGRIELRDRTGVPVSSLIWGTAGGSPAILPGFSLARSAAGPAILTPFVTPGAANRFPEFDVVLTIPGEGAAMVRDAIVAEWDFYVDQLAAGDAPNIEGEWTITLTNSATGHSDAYRPGALFDADRCVIRHVPEGVYRLRITGTNKLGQTTSDEVAVTMPEMRRQLDASTIDERTMHEGWVRYLLTPGGWWARSRGTIDPPDMTDYFFPGIAGPRSAAAQAMIESFSCPVDRTDDDHEAWARTRVVWGWLHGHILREGDPGYQGAHDYCQQIQGWPSLDDFGECVSRFGGIDFPASCCCTYKAQILTSLLYAAGISPDRVAMACHRYKDDPNWGGRHFSTVLRIGSRWFFFDPELSRTESNLPAAPESTAIYVEECDYAHPESLTVLPGSRIGSVPLVEW